VIGIGGFLRRALAYNFDQFRAAPANLIAGALGMVINNVLFLSGIWMMLFAGKDENRPIQLYFIALNALVMVSWGFVNFLVGGLRELGSFVEEGTLEPMLATPRHPLWLVAFSRNHVPAFGDLVMGVLLLGLLAALGDPAMASRALAAIAISCVAWAGFFVLVGSLAFFLPRGASVGEFLLNAILSLSSYPTGRMFEGWGRIVLLSLPVGAISILPLEALMGAGWRSYALAAGGAGILFLAGLGLFRAGARRYRTVSLIGARV